MRTQRGPAQLLLRLPAQPQYCAPRPPCTVWDGSLTDRNTGVTVSNQYLDSTKHTPPPPPAVHAGPPYRPHPQHRLCVLEVQRAQRTRMAGSCRNPRGHAARMGPEGLSRGACRGWDLLGTRALCGFAGWGCAGRRRRPAPPEVVLHADRHTFSHGDPGCVASQLALTRGLALLRHVSPCRRCCSWRTTTS